MTTKFQRGVDVTTWVVIAMFVAYVFIKIS